MKRHFTAQVIQGLKHNPEASQAANTFYDTEKPAGFGIRVGKKRKTWFVRYRLGSMDYYQTLGTYPVLGLADARKEANTFLAKIQTGLDPIAEKREQEKQISFEKLCDTYMERHAKPNKRSWKEDERKIKNNLAVWFDREALSITPAEVVALLDEAKGPSAARLLFILINGIYKRAPQYGLPTGNYNPTRELMSPKQPEKKKRVLSEKEIKRVWNAIDELPARTAPVYRFYFKFLIACGQRRDETRLAKWEHIDEKKGEWFIPGEVTKGKRNHKVPITPIMKQLLSGLKELREGSEFVFPSAIIKGQPFDNFTDALEKLRKILNDDKPMEHFVPHDFRRTMITQMSGLGIEWAHVQRVVNHKSLDKLENIYNQYDYWKEKKAAMKKWNDKLQKIIAAKG